jgi:uncharacterized protein
MITSGYYHNLILRRFSPNGAYLNDGEEEVLLPNRYLDKSWEVGHRLEVFVYTDSEDRLVATTDRPYAAADEFKGLKLKQVTPFGAFFDWGLPKDLLVPKREMYKNMQEGNTYVVMLLNDPQSNRVVGSCLVDSFLHKPSEELDLKADRQLIVYGESDLGYQVIVDGKWKGLLYRNEVFQVLSVGDELTGYIHQQREDGKLDMRLRADRDDLEGKILRKLGNSKGFLAVHDKSTPEQIYALFGVSKKVFKATLGNLYREKKITIKDDGIYLN